MVEKIVKFIEMLKSVFEFEEFREFIERVKKDGIVLFFDENKNVIVEILVRELMN